MSRFNVTMLEEAVEDVLIGKQFYEESEEGVGLYFAASALAEQNQVEVIAVLDMRRNPKSLRAILANRKSHPDEDGNG
ncbi:MAG: hypothetical protein ACNA77_08605 [Opitutales bacterium]